MCFLEFPALSLLRGLQAEPAAVLVCSRAVRHCSGFREISQEYFCRGIAPVLEQAGNLER